MFSEEFSSNRTGRNQNCVSPVWYNISSKLKTNPTVKRFSLNFTVDFSKHIFRRKKLLIRLFFLVSLGGTLIRFHCATAKSVDFQEKMR